MGQLETLARMIVDLRPTLNGLYPIRDLKAIKYIVIHHTGVDVDSTPEEIDSYHKSLGWGGIGYHLHAAKNGVVSYCGDISTKRANVWGRNGEVVGVVLSGDFTNHPPSDTQLRGARLAVRYVKMLLGRDVPVKGHGEIALSQSPTNCPGITFTYWVGKVQ